MLTKWNKSWHREVKVGRLYKFGLLLGYLISFNPDFHNSYKLNPNQFMQDVLIRVGALLNIIFLRVPGAKGALFRFL